ncbi:decaprenyl-phosphate phosphoribosyltransferase [Pseudonocardia lacus]|uniref:decaprenyl-phosphate phosphoribosyltransferase n=1 Tax=Pseudonocardia lacus TaxID=2835865 RepID=UPI0038B421A1
MNGPDPEAGSQAEATTEAESTTEAEETTTAASTPQLPDAPAAEEAVVEPTTEPDLAGPTGDESAGPVDPHPTRTPGRVAAGVLRTMRPRQWVKNVLVLAAPFAAGDIFMPGIALDLLVAFAAFSIAASGIYLVNDANDVAADRAHPTKRNRPIAAGIVPVPLALGVAVVLLLGALALSAVASLQLLAVLGVYVAVQLSYCFWLKHQPVLDICIVASGFLLRAVAGGAATGIPLSQWFLLSAGFGSLFMVAGKRYAEMMLAERTGAKIRKSLESYSASYLRFVWALSATVLITTYCLWAFAIGEQQHNMVYSAISIVPFVVAVLRYSVDVDGGNGGEPEEIALGDRVLQVLAFLWVATLTAAVYF